MRGQGPVPSFRDDFCFANNVKFWFCFVGNFLIPKEKSISKIGHGMFRGWGFERGGKKGCGFQTWGLIQTYSL